MCTSFQPYPLLQRNSHTMYFIKLKYCSTVLSAICFICYMVSISQLNTHSLDISVSSHIDSGRITTIYLTMFHFGAEMGLSALTFLSPGSLEPAPALDSTCQSMKHICPKYNLSHLVPFPWLLLAFL